MHPIQPGSQDDQERIEAMRRDVFLVATAGLSLLNGMPFSPLMGPGLPIGPVGLLLKPFVAGTFLSTPIVFGYLTSIFCSLMTLLVAGIPAALYERYTGAKESTGISLGIWLFATIVLTAPALLAAMSR